MVFRFSWACILACRVFRTKGMVPFDLAREMIEWDRFCFGFSRIVIYTRPQINTNIFQKLKKFQKFAKNAKILENQNKIMAKGQNRKKIGFSDFVASYTIVLIRKWHQIRASQSIGSSEKIGKNLKIRTLVIKWAKMALC